MASGHSGQQGFSADSWQCYWGFALALNKLNGTNKVWAWNPPYYWIGPWHSLGPSPLVLFQMMPKHSLGINLGHGPPPIGILDVATVIWRVNIAVWMQALSCQLASRKSLWLILCNNLEVVSASRSSLPFQSCWSQQSVLSPKIGSVTWHSVGWPE